MPKEAAVMCNGKRERFDALPSPEVSSAEVGAIQRGEGFTIHRRETITGYSDTFPAGESPVGETSS
jgi:hypothetical protein